MRLLDNVCLIESEVLALACLNAQSQVMNTVILGISSEIVHGSMIRSHRWKKTMEK